MEGGGHCPACHHGAMTATPELPDTGADQEPALARYPVTPPPLPRPITFDQRWRDLTFVHWPVAPDSIAHLYPTGTRPDVFADGSTYVGLIPFAMSYTTVRIRDLPCNSVWSGWIV